LSRPEWGLVALNAWLVAVGLAVLYGFGLVRSVRAGIGFTGLALCVGWAAIGIVAALALMAGAAVSEMQVVAIAGGIAALGLAAGRKVPPMAEVRGARSWYDLIAVPAVGALLVYGWKLFERARVDSLGDWDVWAAWMPKAQAIVYFDGLDTRPGGYLDLGHAHYPPLAPAQDAIAFRFMHEVDPLMLPVQHWVFAVATFAALAALLAPVVPAVALWPSLLMLAITPNVADLIGSSLGDEPLAFLFALAGIAALRWLLEDEHRFALLTGLFMTAAALTKNEGLLLALVLVAALTAASWDRLRSRWSVLAGTAAAPLLAQLAWNVWFRSKHVEIVADYRLGDLARPAYLLDRLDRLGYALRELPGYVFAPHQWHYTAPFFLLAAALAAVSAPRLALATLGTAVTAFLGLAAVYWVGSPDVAWWIDTSAERVVSSIALFCGSAFPLLVAVSLGDRAAPKPPG
jgi:hypothetical protein